MPKIITMTAYRRPDYTRQVLAALAKCEGIADWLFLPQIEPGNDEVIEHFERWDACEIKPEVNRSRRGLSRNTHDALARAVRLKPDVLVHLEDDTVPSPDALLYFEWAVRDILIPDRKSKDGHQITLAAGHSKNAVRPTPEQSHLCDTRPIFTPWGWAVDITRLRWMLWEWCFKNSKCFTCIFKYRYSRTRREMYPLLSRVQNIGYEMGENGRSPEWYRAHHRARHVAGDMGPGEFALR